jgi:hypothetical protein
MHIDNASRRPDPVIFFGTGDFAVLTVFHFDLPLHSGEIDAPNVTACHGWSFLHGEFTQDAPRIAISIDQPVSLSAALFRVPLT